MSNDKFEAKETSCWSKDTTTARAELAQEVGKVFQNRGLWHTEHLLLNRGLWRTEHLLFLVYVEFMEMSINKSAAYQTSCWSKDTTTARAELAQEVGKVFQNRGLWHTEHLLLNRGPWHTEHLLFLVYIKFIEMSINKSAAYQTSCWSKDTTTARTGLAQEVGELFQNCGLWRTVHLLFLVYIGFIEMSINKSAAYQTSCWSKDTTTARAGLAQEVGKLFQNCGLWHTEHLLLNRGLWHTEHLFFLVYIKFIEMSINKSAAYQTSCWSKDTTTARTGLAQEVGKLFQNCGLWHTEHLLFLVYIEFIEMSKSFSPAPSLHSLQIKQSFATSCKPGTFLFTRVSNT